MAPRITVANGTGGTLHLISDKEAVKLPLMGSQGGTAEMTFNAGSKLEFEKVVASPDGRFVTLSLDATFGNLSIGKEGQIETETAKHSYTLSLPKGHTVLLRTSFIKKQVIGIFRTSVSTKLGPSTRDRVLEKTVPDAKPEAYLYILIKPTIIAKPEAKRTFPTLGER